MDYDFVEIGTCDFATLIQKANEQTVGLSVDCMQEYLDNLPTKPRVTKVCAGVSSTDGTMTVYYIPRITIEELSLPKWMKGCNRIGSPHPIVLRYLTKHSYPHSIIKTREVPILSVRQLFDQHNVRSIDMLKIDTEGHDSIIVSAYLDLCVEHPCLLANTIRFESNSLSNKEIVAELCARLTGMGYNVRHVRGHDTVATKV